MDARTVPRVLTSAQLTEGYEKSVTTASRLLMAGMVLSREYPDVALGLAEIGQEELGKSLGILAAFFLPGDPTSWGWFWSEWRDHDKKAHRAFLYELIHPRRIEMRGPDDQLRSGLPMRARIRQEKESSFYVNFDSKSGRFESPEEAVPGVEMFNRTIALLNLSVTAWHVRAALEAEETAFRLHSFSEVAFRICSEELYQQDMPAILAEFEARSPRHGALVSALRTQLLASDQYLESIVGASAPPAQL